ncbi:MAG TPA: DUF1592 domain-containing protein [Polyangiaceae bacterium]
MEPLRTLGLTTAILVGASCGCSGAIGAEGDPPAMQAPEGTSSTAGAQGATSTTTGGTADPDLPTTTTGGQVPVGGDEVESLCAAQTTPTIGRTLLRRMTRQQYDNTVHDLLGIEGQPAANISPDEKVGPFYSNARTPIVDLVVQQHAEAAAAVAAQARERMATLAPCDLETGGEACAASFIEAFGLRAYRRPLAAAERDAYVALFAAGSALGGAAEGFEFVVATMLQSPFFLYHVDVGEGGVPSATPAALTGYELASRLSYFLWNSMPDDRLFELAAGDQLGDSVVLEGEVTRMLADARALRAIPEFHLQWLGIGDMTDVVKDAASFPSFGPELVAAMLAETSNFSSHVILQGDGLLSTLFTAPYSVIDGPLFALYGAAEPAGFAPGQTVPLDPTQRSGLLTQAAFLATHAHRDQTSPVHRGIAIRENLLCQTLDPPPANVNNVAPAPTEATTTRERFAEHSSNAVCAGCHRLVDPIGLGLENYDPIGAFRTTDGPAPVDATGEIVDAGADVEGPFNGAIELSQRLAQSQLVADCMANQWFRFALGRIEANDDACTLEAIYEGFDASGHDVRRLITEIVLSESFRSVKLEGSAEGL